MSPLDTRCPICDARPGERCMVYGEPGPTHAQRRLPPSRRERRPYDIAPIDAGEQLALLEAERAANPPAPRPGELTEEECRLGLAEIAKARALLHRAP